jgi:1,2-diacylglycerol 3-beta-galactosyltransferase
MMQACITALIVAFSLARIASGFIQQSIQTRQLCGYETDDNLQHSKEKSNCGTPIQIPSWLMSTILLDREVEIENFVDQNSVQDDEFATIQILMSDTGGGHRASANALRDAFDVLYPGKIQCDIVDIYTEYGPVWPYNDYVAMYKLMAKNPWTWELFYKFGSTKVGLALNNFLLETFCFDAFTKCLARPQPATGKRADMVVSVHPLTQDVPLKVLAYLDSAGKSKAFAARTKTPFATVVTDLGSAHPTWFNANVDKCFVPSDALFQAARDRSLHITQLKQHGLPIRKGFWGTGGTTLLEKTEKERLRKSLGVQSDLPTVLVVGGGDGMGGLVDISKALGKQLGNNKNCRYQIVIVCGNNQHAKASLEAHSWSDSVHAIVKGFVNNMDDWMKASDVLVTKAGPGTIAEASICGLPCMMFSYL